MARRNKLRKFSDLSTFKNVFQCFDPTAPSLVGMDNQKVELKGKWNTDHFKNNNPIVLELACGRGEYTLALGAMYPDKNFIGVDVKGARIWQGAVHSREQNLENVAFLRTRIEKIDFFFMPDEVEEIWITFPDPFERASKANRRLTYHNFHDYYRKFLKPGGIVQLKTDSDSLWENTLESLAEDKRITILYQNDNIYDSPLDFPELEFKTYYEKSHLEKGRLIKYIRYTIH